MRFKTWCMLAVLAIAIAWPVHFASAQEETTETTTITTIEEDYACPASVEIGFSVWSDYIFRGINFSEYPGEGREAFNYQLVTSLGLDIGVLFGEAAGTCGTLHIDSFWEWYEDQEQLDPVHGGQNLQEIDLTLKYSYNIEPIMSTLSVGWTHYKFPNHNDINTHEWFIGVDHNDAWMWRWAGYDGDEGIFNPSFTVYHDVDFAAGGTWFEFGLSHAFIPCENVTITPSWMIAYEHNYYSRLIGGTDDTNRLATMTWGLDVAYDITELMRFPSDWGTVGLSSFIYFSDAMSTTMEEGVITDELYGGMALTWAYGG